MFRLICRHSTKIREWEFCYCHFLHGSDRLFIASGHPIRISSTHWSSVLWVRFIWIILLNKQDINDVFIEGKNSPSLLSLEIIPCGKQHSVCEANVILNESVELDKIYELSLSVRDTSGEVTTVFCTVQVTNTSASLTDTFQHLNQYLTVPEVMI